jgi:hypothetical protein
MDLCPAALEDGTLPLVILDYSMAISSTLVNMNHNQVILSKGPMVGFQTPQCPQVGHSI